MNFCLEFYLKMRSSYNVRKVGSYDCKMGNIISNNFTNSWPFPLKFSEHPTDSPNILFWKIYGCGTIFLLNLHNFSEKIAYTHWKQKSIKTEYNCGNEKFY